MGRHYYSPRRRSAESNTQLDYTRRFLLRSTFRFMRNLVADYQGHLNDEDFFAPVASRIGDTVLRRIFNGSTAPALRRTLLELDRDDKIDLSGESPETLLHRLWEHPRTNAKFRELLTAHLDSELERMRELWGDDPAPEERRFAELREFFRLTRAESDLVLLSRLTLGFWNCDDLRGTISYGKFNRFACALGIPEAELQKIGREDGRLRQLECVDEDLDFNRKLLPFLSGADDTPLAANYYSA